MIETTGITLLGVWAHPDDETYLSAALMRRVVASGGKVVLATATRGELGTDYPALARNVLARRREAELVAAMAELGVHDVRFLGYADGGCAEADTDRAAAAIEEIIRAVRPDVMVTFGRDGITRHPDHVAVSAWTTRAWASVANAIGADGRVPHLLYATMTDELVAAHALGYPEVQLTLDGRPATSVPAADVALHVVPDRDERDRKRAALSAHASQIGPLVELLGEQRFHDWWAEEMFRQPTVAELAAVGVSTPSRVPLQAPPPSPIAHGHADRRHTRPAARCTRRHASRRPRALPVGDVRWRRGHR